MLSVDHNKNDKFLPSFSRMRDLRSREVILAVTATVLILGLVAIVLWHKYKTEEMVQEYQYRHQQQKYQHERSMQEYQIRKHQLHLEERKL
jgi:ABC-type nickel/cobalt efflux system permease component RcnA